MEKIDEADFIKKIYIDKELRMALCRKSHYWFFHTYLPDYVKYPTADFQKEIFQITENDNIRTAVITAFRGSAKSTIVSLSYPIWAMLKVQAKKHIVIISQTQQLCEVILDNIRRELEKNSLLSSDFGPFRQVSDKWNSSILIVNDCRISAISCGEAIRGIRFGEDRPDLIILDDVEDLSSVKTKEGRDKTFNWLTGDVIPIGDINTKIMIIGNKLHEDGLMMRLKKAIDEDKFSAIYRQYPLLDNNGNCLWPGKFSTPENITELRKSIPSESAWRREYLLEIVNEEDAVVLPQWIKYYHEIYEDSEDLRYIAIAVDLAISEKDSADFTAMVAAKVYS
ncbi:MAG: hypothetical protein M1308_09030 [Actinobacteria bacterium]|nr:hypothetical protein [Actinomycetota bacterium]